VIHEQSSGNTVSRYRDDCIAMTVSQYCCHDIVKMQIGHDYTSAVLALTFCVFTCPDSSFCCGLPSLLGMQLLFSSRIEVVLLANYDIEASSALDLMLLLV
jgi:hypothetical protein